ncbi:hypothetical protein LWI28_002068 [Acer negundo]|uniref:Thaumatin-like protein n=1 Tax=Acer negundo TaxID=4023 RepID=A0AAD5JHZ1_ACENE|nr:hypothetical protein LWI28_002068 [Acer negundo]
MALFHFHFLSLFLFILIVIFSSGPRISESARVFTMINSCKETVWPGITPGDNFNGGGFPLQSGQSIVFKAPVGWSGRIWGRTGCNFDKNGVGTCQTGRCGSALQCKASGETPATLAEFTLATLDFYDEVCPTSYSYAYDDPSSIFTCSGTDYVITFCAPRKQPVCTYHNNKLVCSGSNGLKSFICTSWLVMLAIVLMVNWWIISP